MGITKSVRTKEVKRSLSKIRSDLTRSMEQRSMLLFAMASRGCQCTRTHGIPSTPQTHKELPLKQNNFYGIVWSQHFEFIIEHYSTATTRSLFNHNFWACTAGTKELQSILSTSGRWAHLVTLSDHKKAPTLIQLPFQKCTSSFTGIWKGVFSLRHSSTYSLENLSRCIKGESVTAEGNFQLLGTKS